MNAPINPAILAAASAASATMPRCAPIEQPCIPADMALLMSGFSQDGLYLDLYGYADEDDGCSVEAVALMGDDRDLTVLFKAGALKTLSWAVDRAGVQSRARSRDEGRAERALIEHA